MKLCNTNNPDEMVDIYLEEDLSRVIDFYHKGLYVESVRKDFIDKTEAFLDYKQSIENYKYGGYEEGGLNQIATIRPKEIEINQEKKFDIYLHHALIAAKKTINLDFDPNHYREDIEIYTIHKSYEALNLQDGSVLEPKFMILKTNKNNPNEIDSIKFVGQGVDDKGKSSSFYTQDVSCNQVYSVLWRDTDGAKHTIIPSQVEPLEKIGNINELNALVTKISMRANFNKLTYEEIYKNANFTKTILAINNHSPLEYKEKDLEYLNNPNELHRKTKIALKRLDYMENQIRAHINKRILNKEEHTICNDKAKQIQQKSKHKRR